MITHKTPPASSEIVPASPSPPASRRRRGAQPGNLNAVKHGFYTRRIHKTDLTDLEGSTFKGLAEEIAILRLFTRRLIERYSSSADLMETMLMLRTLCFASSCLNRLVKTQHLIFGLDSQSPGRDAFEQALQDIAESMAALGELDRSQGLPAAGMEPFQSIDPFCTTESE